MSEELIQRNLIEVPETMGTWDYYNIGTTTLKALKGAKIIINKDYGKFENKKPDALIVKKPQVIAAIEYKHPKELRRRKQIEAAIAQEIETARALGAKLYIVTDGNKTFWINPMTGNEITAEDGSRIALNFNKDDVECIKLINKAIMSISATNDSILFSVAVDPLPLAQKVWQDLWSVSGATPENCLYTFVEIFIFKYLSDLGILTGLFSFSNLLNQYKTNTENEVIDYYASTIRVKIKELFPLNPKDRTTIINGTIFVSKNDKAVSGYATVFKKILERFDSFGTLENIDYDFKSKLFETFLKESISKKNWGQFFTPLKVVRAIVSMTDIVPGMTICDPACGVGKFLLELILHDIHRWFKIKNGTLIPQVTLRGFDKGFDKDEQKTIILAKANMLIYMSSIIREYSGLTEQFAQLFNDTFLLQTNSILGTLANPEVEKYDLILTNPPYVMSGSSNLKDEISKKTSAEVINKRKSLLEQHYAISAMGVEGLFMEWIIRALKPGGKAFVVVPDGIMNRSNDKRLRDFILDECVIDAVISLPLNTFFTTNKKTYIMALTKKIPASLDGTIIKGRQVTPVFTYLCSEIGETRDVYRFDIEQNDLDIAATTYNMFKGACEHYTTNDKRCKIVGIDDFYNGAHWSIERWWTREERIELGIEDEPNLVDVNQFVSIISDIAATISAYQEPLLELEKKKIYDERVRCVSLLDKNLFTLITSGIGFNRTALSAIDTHKEKDFPVFTAGKEPVAHIGVLKSKKPILASNEHLLLSFATNGDGSAGRNFIVHNRPFYINVDRLAIDIKDKNILLPYLYSQLSDMKEKYKFNHSNKANRHNLVFVNIDIPVDENGEFDIKKQAVIAEQFLILNDIRKEIVQKHREVADFVIEPSRILEITRSKTVSLNDKSFFELSIGKRLLKKDFFQKSGSIPIYSANVNVPFAFTEMTNISDFSLPYVIWGIDGDFEFNVMDSGVKFAATDHCGMIKIKSMYIDPIFLMYSLKRIRHQYGFDRGLRASLTNMKKIEISIPLNKNGDFDIEIQRKIAKAYTTLESYKHNILDKLNTLITQKVDL